MLFITLKEFIELDRCNYDSTCLSKAHIKSLILAKCWYDSNFVFTDEDSWKSNNQVISKIVPDCKFNKDSYTLLGVECDTNLKDKSLDNSQKIMNKKENESIPVEKSNFF